MYHLPKSNDVEGIIYSFRNEFAFLSNYYESTLEIFGKKFCSVEYAYQPQKAVTDEDRRWVKNVATPRVAKERGGQIQCRQDWDQIKDKIMMDCLRQKFFHNPRSRQKLLATGTRFISFENAHHDQYWGTCRCGHHYTSPGCNKLGLFLMGLRELLRE